MVKIVTDSTSDLPKELVERYNIHVIPLTVFFGEDAYKDGIDLTPDSFIEKLKAAKELPTTSQPSPGDFAELYKNLTEDGSEVVSLHISSALSGTYQSAVMGYEMLEEGKVYPVDTRSATVGLGLLAVEAAKMAEAGESAEMIAEKMNAWVPNHHLFLAVDTLEFLQKGGRIGRAQGLLGSLLNIKPILRLVDGVVTPVEKVRGFSKAVNRMVEAALSEIKPGQKAVFATSHLANPQGSQTISDKIKEKYPDAEIIVNDGGPVIGAHVGPGTVGVVVQVMPE
jgi:DegV family protein with EDD domain